jgi:D-glycero-D-manno-heptose 1,7-bisphosphate phosphatase
MAYKLVIVTNQGGLSLGHITENDLDHIHTRLLSMLKEKGILIDMILAAGWHEKGHIKKYSPAWRKPEPGMLLHAAGALNIDLDASFMIGDRLSDIKAGQRAGCRTIYVRTGEEENLADLPVQPDFNASNLAAAADFILQDLPVEPPDSRYDPKES